MNKAFVYVLGCKDQKLYSGSTRDLMKRIKDHEMGRVKTTKSQRPVQLVYSEEFENYTDARKREIYLKTGTGRDWLKSKMEGLPSGLRRRSCSPRRVRLGRKYRCKGHG